MGYSWFCYWLYPETRIQGGVYIQGSAYRGSLHLGEVCIGGGHIPIPELEKRAVLILLECFLILCLQVEVEAAAEVEVPLVEEVVAAEEEAEVRYMVIQKESSWKAILEFHNYSGYYLHWMHMYLFLEHFQIKKTRVQHLYSQYIQTLIDPLWPYHEQVNKSQ